MILRTAWWFGTPWWFKDVSSKHHVLLEAGGIGLLEGRQGAYSWKSHTAPNYLEAHATIPFFLVAFFSA